MGRYTMFQVNKIHVCSNKKNACRQEYKLLGIPTMRTLQQKTFPVSIVIC
jgi:hypothetical protein